MNILAHVMFKAPLSNNCTCQEVSLICLIEDIFLKSFVFLSRVKRPTQFSFFTHICRGSQNA